MIDGIRTNEFTIIIVEYASATGLKPILSLVRCFIIIAQAVDPNGYIRAHKTGIHVGKVLTTSYALLLTSPFKHIKMDPITIQIIPKI